MQEAEKKRKGRERCGSQNRLSRVSALVPGDRLCPVAETVPDPRSIPQQPLSRRQLAQVCLRQTISFKA